MAVPQNFKQITIGLSNSIARYTSTKNKSSHQKNCTLIFKAALFTIAKKVETMQMSFNQWMDKQKVVYPYDEVLFSNKKKWTTVTYRKMVKPQRHHTQWKPQDTKEYRLWNGETRQICKESRWLGSQLGLGGEGKGTQGLTTNGQKGPFWSDRNVPKLNCGDSGAIL